MFGSHRVHDQLSYFFKIFFDLTCFVFRIGQAIVTAVTSGSKRFFLGTDSAPHERRRKECPCGCAGIYSAPVALSLYAKVFEEVISNIICHILPGKSFLFSFNFRAFVSFLLFLQYM